MPETIDVVVRAANAEAGYKTLHKYVLFLHFAFDAFYKLKRDNVNLSYTHLNLAVTNRVATIPAEVLEIGQVGKQAGVQVVQFVPDAFLSLDPAATPSSAPSFSDGIQIIKYRHDREGGKVVFERDPPGGVVYLEVVRRLALPNSFTVVHDAAVIPMKAYIHYRHARFKFGAASAEAKEAEQEYLNEVDEALAGLSDLTPQGIMHAMINKNNPSGRYYVPV